MKDCKREQYIILSGASKTKEDQKSAMENIEEVLNETRFKSAVKFLNIVNKKNDKSSAQE
tara:strand:+ start:984 stop:1163 length:180 start_codon:yes stop_codon:yes gene_type:complete